MSELKTVEEFKDAGLVFVEGDKGSGYSISHPEEFNVGATYDGSDAESFAWRTNTGEKPEFTGLTAFKFENSIGYGHIQSISNWSDVIEWRPHLPSSQTETPEEKEAFDKMADNTNAQYESLAEPVKPAFTQAMVDAGEWHVWDDSAIKPVFTQDMADAGEYAKIGMKVSYPSGSGELALGADNNGICIVIEDGAYKRVDFSSLKPIKSPRDKAIDDMYHIIRIHAKVKNAAAALYDDGYRKVES